MSDINIELTLAAATGEGVGIELILAVTVVSNTGVELMLVVIIVSKVGVGLILVATVASDVDIKLTLVVANSTDVSVEVMLAASTVLVIGIELKLTVTVTSGIGVDALKVVNIVSEIRLEVMFSKEYIMEAELMLAGELVLKEGVLVGVALRDAGEYVVLTLSSGVEYGIVALIFTETTASEEENTASEGVNVKLALICIRLDSALDVAVSVADKLLLVIEGMGIEEVSNTDDGLINATDEVFVVAAVGVKLRTVNVVDVIFTREAVEEVGLLVNGVAIGVASIADVAATKVYNELVILLETTVSDGVGTEMVPVTKLGEKLVAVFNKEELAIMDAEVDGCRLV